MSIWAPVLAAFWFWYFVDCLRIARCRRFLFTGPSGAPRAHALLSRWLFGWPTPLGWMLVSDDPPVSISPIGIANVAPASAGRPAPEPDSPQAWRWEKIEEFEARGSWLWINDQRFCPLTAFSQPTHLAHLRDLCLHGSPGERSQIIEGEIDGWFPTTQPRRQLRIWRHRTRWLAVAATLSWTAFAALSVYLLGGFGEHLQASQLAWLVRWLPTIAVAYLFLHVETLMLAWSAHRQLLPHERAGRFTLIAAAALLPPIALRLRAQIGAAYFRPRHPLAWSAACCSNEDFQIHARHFATDLAWPLPLNRGPEALLAEIVCWTRATIRRRATAVLATRDTNLDASAMPPAREGPRSCLYCPRCGDQFSTEDGRCPRGISLQRFDR